MSFLSNMQCKIIIKELIKSVWIQTFDYETIVLPVGYSTETYISRVNGDKVTYDMYNYTYIYHTFCHIWQINYCINA